MEGHWEWIGPIIEADRDILMGEFEKMDDRVRETSNNEMQLRERLEVLSAQVRRIKKLQEEGWDMDQAEAQRVTQDHQNVLKQYKLARQAAIHANEKKHWFVANNSARCERLAKALENGEGWYYIEEAERNIMY